MFLSTIHPGRYIIDRNQYAFRVLTGLPTDISLVGKWHVEQFFSRNKTAHTSLFQFFALNFAKQLSDAQLFDGEVQEQLIELRS